MYSDWNIYHVLSNADPNLFVDAVLRLPSAPASQENIAGTVAVAFNRRKTLTLTLYSWEIQYNSAYSQCWGTQWTTVKTE